MAKDIKFNIKLNVDGKEQIVSASTNVKELASNLGIAKDSMSGFRDAMRTFANVSMAIQGLNSAIQGLAQQVKDLTDAYAVQEQAEVQLATAMRNTMGASDEEIASIRELCAAQQQLGVIGDEVQLAGAKELALHVRSKSAIEALIPVMNDLAVKQDGLNVSSSTTASIAQMMGKALEGNTNALKRAGIFLSDAQQQALKFGTEEEKVRVLTEAITAQVGGMNAELAKTDSGRMQQMSNTIGDVKENLGKMVSGIAPAIQMAAQLGLALNGIVMLGGGLKSVVGVVMSLSAWLKATAASATVAGTAIRAVGVALKGAFIASGIGAAIMAVVWAVDALTNSTNEAAEGFDALKEAEEERQRVTAENIVKFDEEIKKLGDLIRAHKDTTAAVDHLNSSYGNIFGTHKTAVEWYDTLIAKSRAYCMQLGYEAEAQVVAQNIAKKRMQLDKMNEDIHNEFANTPRIQKGAAKGGFHAQDWDRIQEKRKKRDKQAREILEDEADLTKLQQKIQQEAAKVGSPKSSSTPTTQPTGVRGARGGRAANVLSLIADPQTISDLENNVRYYEQAIKKCNIADTERLASLRTTKNALQEQIKKLEEVGKANLEAKAVEGEIPKVDVPVTPKPVFDMREWAMSFRQAMVDKAEGLKVDVKLGLIGEKELKEKIDEINKALKELGMEPIDLNLNVDSVENSVAKLGQSIASLGSAIDLPVLNIAGTLAQAIATMTLAYAKAQALAAAGSGPIGWLAFAAAGLAQLTAIVTSVKSLNKFAEGGIAYGPTLGLFGEYAGARSNPEVVAPLDRLRSMIQPTGYGGNVRFHIEGRDLVGVLSNETRITAKSGRRL